MPALTDLVDRLKPSVVRITTQVGAGSGFIAHKDGYVVTNAHVVKEFKMVEIELFDGRTLPGDVVVTSDNADLAVVKIANSLGARVAPFGDSDKIKDGAEVFTLGFPLGHALSGDATTTRGIISARRQRANVENFQIDAAINPGNSGGPLFDMNGEVVGVNTSRPDETPSGRIIGGIAFSITSNEVVERLRARLPDIFMPDPPEPAPDILKVLKPWTQRFDFSGNLGGTTPNSDMKLDDEPPSPPPIREFGQQRFDF